MEKWAGFFVNIATSVACRGSNRLFQCPRIVPELAGIRRPAVQSRGGGNNDLLALRGYGILRQDRHQRRLPEIGILLPNNFIAEQVLLPNKFYCPTHLETATLVAVCV